MLSSMSALGKTIIVLDAAVLLDAGWDRYVHEVWVTIIPRDEVRNMKQYVSVCYLLVSWIFV